MAYETYREQVAIQSAPSIQGAAQSQSNAALNLLRSFNEAAQGVSNVIQVEGAITEKKEINAATDKALTNIADGNLSYEEGETRAVEAYNKLIANASVAKLENELKLGMGQLAKEYENDIEGFNLASDEFLKQVVDGQKGSLETQANLKVYGSNLKRGNEVGIAQRQVALTKEVAKSDILINLTSKGEDVLTNARSGDLDVAAFLYSNLSEYTQGLVESGDMSAEKRASILITTENGMFQESLLGEFDSAIGTSLKDAGDYIDQLEEQQRSGEYVELDPATLDSTISTMKAEYNSKLRELQALKKAEDKAKEDKVELESLTIDVSEAINSGIPLDWKNTDDKKAVNKVFDSQAGDWSLANPAQQQQAIDFATAVGVVPEKVISKIRTAVYAGNPEAARAGVDLINRMITNNPALTNQFSEKDVTYAIGVERLVSAGETIQKAMELQKQWDTRPIQERKKEIMSGYSGDSFDKEVGIRLDNFIDANFDRSWFSSQPEAPAVMKADYTVLYEKYIAATGNVEDAARLTNIAINNKWGVTYVNGKSEMMPFPPEKLLANSLDEVSWINSDLDNVRTEIAKLQPNYIEGESKAEIKLVADGDLLTKSQPRWLVLVKGGGGLYSPHLSERGLPMYWTASYKTSPEYAEAKAEQKAKVESAKLRDKLIHQYEDEDGLGAQLSNARRVYSFPTSR